MSEVTLAIITIVLSSVSLGSCSFVIYLYAAFRELRNDQFTIVLQIILFDFIYDLILLSDSIGYLFLSDSDFLLSYKPVLCQTQAFFSVYSVISSTMWTSIIIHSLYQAVQSDDQHSYMQTFYPALGYGIPLLISIIPIIIDAYGQYYPMPQTNCFFDANNTNMQLYVLLFFDIPIWIMFIYNIVVIVLVIRLMKQQDLEIKQLYSLFMYPGILAVCWIIVYIDFNKPGLINIFGIKSFVWKCIDFSLGSLIGFLDSYWYCYIALTDKLEFRNGRFQVKLQNAKSEEQELPKY